MTDQSMYGRQGRHPPSDNPRTSPGSARSAAAFGTTRQTSTWGMSDNLKQPEPALLSLAEVAHELGISRTTLWRLTTSGELPVVHIGSRSLIPRAALEKFIAERVRV